jgi:hypothetical protein
MHGARARSHLPSPLGSEDEAEFKDTVIAIDSDEEKSDQ